MNRSLIVLMVLAAGCGAGDATQGAPAGTDVAADAPPVEPVDTTSEADAPAEDAVNDTFFGEDATDVQASPDVADVPDVTEAPEVEGADVEVEVPDTGTLSCGEGCPAVLKPVCAEIDGSLVEVESSCVVAQCGGTIECAAPCDDELYPDCAESGCAPVCGVNGKTYRNACYALSQDATVAYAGACCGCPVAGPGDLVCGADDNEYPSECVAGCKGIPVAYPGPCIEGCSDTGEPPACGRYLGALTGFANAACAEAAGAECIFEGACDDVAACLTADTTYAPVCATTAVAGPKTFANACHAACAGAVVESQGLCEACATNCPADGPAPLAHCAPQQDCVLYPNGCVPTKCLGYPVESLQKHDCPDPCPAP